MERDTYVQTLRASQLRGIRLRAAHVELLADDLADVNLAPTVSAKVEHRLVSTNSAVATVHFRLAAPRLASRADGVRLKATYEVHLGCTDELTDEFVSLYAANNAAFNAWPFFRQWVASVTGEMGFPPLMLGFRFVS